MSIYVDICVDELIMACVVVDVVFTLMTIHVAELMPIYAVQLMFTYVVQLMFTSVAKLLAAFVVVLLALEVELSIDFVSRQAVVSLVKYLVAIVAVLSTEFPV